jgi:hypothetical protein
MKIICCIQLGTYHSVVDLSVTFTSGCTKYIALILDIQSRGGHAGASYQNGIGIEPTTFSKAAQLAR